MATGQLDSALVRAESAVALTDDEATPTVTAVLRRAEAQLIRGEVFAAEDRLITAARDWEAALAVLEPLADGIEVNELRPLRTSILLVLDRVEEPAPEYAKLGEAGYVEPRLQAPAREKGLN